MTRSEARTETSRQLNNARETLKLAKSQGAKTIAQNKIDYLVAVQKALCGPTKETVEQMRGEWREEIVKKCDWRGKKQNYYQPHSCSKCHMPDPGSGKSNFRPNCGAPMTNKAVDILWQRRNEHDA